MSFKNYNFYDELNTTIKLYNGNPANVEKMFEDSLKLYPNETRYLYNGKLYVFDYTEDTQKLYDTNPYVISLGPTKSDDTTYYCLNLHYIPYKIRLQIVSLIYNAYSATIDKEIEKHPSVEEGLLQNHLTSLTQGSIKNLARKTNLMGAVHKYKMDGIRNCKCVNYNKVHLMVCSEKNKFANGSIMDAQDMFLRMLNR